MTLNKIRKNKFFLQSSKKVFGASKNLSHVIVKSEIQKTDKNQPLQLKIRLISSSNQI